MRSNLGNVYKTKAWAERWARGRPVRKVEGGWQIMAKRKQKSRRKTYRKKSSAKKKAKGGSVYKVKGGYRVSRKRKRRRR